MTVHDDVEAALAGWAGNAGDADDVTNKLFDDVIVILRRRFPDVSRNEFCLLLADVRRDVGTVIDAFVTGSVDIRDAADVVATRFLGED
jgi:hypothetical protein